MEKGANYINEEKISLGTLIRSLIDWLQFIFSKWLLIGLGAAVILALTLAYNYLKAPTYFAKTSFVLESEGGSGLGGISSLASLAGVDIGGGVLEGSPLFQIDNIQSLYSSHRMLEETLLSPADFDGISTMIIVRFAESQKLARAWSKKGIELESFSIPRDQFSRAQDSVLIESIDIIQENLLHVGKPNRKASILEVGFYHRDELLAKVFNEVHVRNVNQFYAETRTKKTLSNLKVLQVQTDSIKNVLDESIQKLAEVDQAVPNANPLYKTSLVPYQKALLDVQANGGVYQELVKQLELAKITHRNRVPLIQVVDRPILPLRKSRWTLMKTLVLGGFAGVMTMVLFFTIRRIVLSALRDETGSL